MVKSNRRQKVVHGHCLSVCVCVCVCHSGLDLYLSPVSRLHLVLFVYHAELIHFQKAKQKAAAEEGENKAEEKRATKVCMCVCVCVCVYWCFCVVTSRDLYMSLVSRLFYLLII